jgi:hypothetical protein
LSNERTNSEVHNVSNVGLETIASHYYTDPPIYGLEKEHVFYRTWQYVGHVGEIANVGDYFTVKIAHESVLIVRDDQRRPRAYYNVCRHRAHRVLDNLGLGQLVGLFREQEIDFEVLPNLTDGDLEKLGVPLGPRKKRRCSDIYQQRC